MVNAKKAMVKALIMTAVAVILFATPNVDLAPKSTASSLVFPRMASTSQQQAKSKSARTTAQPAFLQQASALHALPNTFWWAAFVLDAVIAIV